MPDTRRRCGTRQTPHNVACPAGSGAAIDGEHNEPVGQYSHINFRIKLGLHDGLQFFIDIYEDGQVVRYRAWASDNFVLFALDVSCAEPRMPIQQVEALQDQAACWAFTHDVLGCVRGAYGIPWRTCREDILDIITEYLGLSKYAKAAE